MNLNDTHDPRAKSWVESANRAGTDFPIQNLPFGVFRHLASSEAPRIGVAIGDVILDMAGAEMEGFFDGDSSRAAQACMAESLNELMSLTPTHWTALRRRLSHLLRSDAPAGFRQRLSRHLVPMGLVEMLMPAAIGDYTDFYASIFHATNVGSMFRPDNPLLPNYKYIPIGYHGRASSIVVSGTPVFRPRGQTRPDPQAEPIFGPTKALDYELEMGIFVGGGNLLGTPIPIDSAARSIFGFCLVNDWSARDMQSWEYQPLGPFLAKNFATSISPWVVTAEALEPFRTRAMERDGADPAPLSYLHSEIDQQEGAFDITLEVRLRTAKMRDQGDKAVMLSRGSFRDMYWTVAQLIAHHASNGCNLRGADLLASGTISGRTKDSRGCLLELTWRGADPIDLPTGETRKFLEDGDEVIFTGSCEKEGYATVGFGECRGEILPPR
ncbi:MAG TPA: fumarylacetoacetase [Terriglobales bacterium]|nr:fumarylacetoacetase [Terriglobales bacterium]